MKLKKFETIEDTKEPMREMLNLLKSVLGFKIGPSIADPFTRMQAHLKAGELTEATKEAQNTLEAGYAILTAFLRNSALPYKDKSDPEVVRDGLFVKELRQRLDTNMHDDLIDGLRVKFSTLLDAVQTETDSFTRRVGAYNALKKAIADADAQQKWRDTNRITADMAKRAGKERRKQAEQATTGRVDTATQRAAMLEERSKKNAELANEFAAML